MTTRHAPTRTRKYGEAKTKVALLGKVDRRVKTKVERVAEALGMSQAAAMELMLDSVKVDANGRPEFFEGPLPSDTQKELPLTG
jgi:hypothetical protein